MRIAQAPITKTGHRVIKRICDGDEKALTVQRLRGSLDRIQFCGWLLPYQAPWGISRCRDR